MATETPERTEFADPHRARRTGYLVIGLVLAAVLVLGLIFYSEGEKTPTAIRKADQLAAAFKQAGLPVPSQRQIVRTLGEDGGAICADPADALNRAIRNGLSTNGAAGPGLRPVWTDRQLVAGEEMALSIYCPDQLPAFLDYINSQEFADTVND